MGILNLDYKGESYYLVTSPWGLVKSFVWREGKPLPYDTSMSISRRGVGLNRLLAGGGYRTSEVCAAPLRLKQCQFLAVAFDFNQMYGGDWNFNLS